MIILRLGLVVCDVALRTEFCLLVSGVYCLWGVDDLVNACRKFQKFLDKRRLHRYSVLYCLVWLWATFLDKDVGVRLCSLSC